MSRYSIQCRPATRFLCKPATSRTSSRSDRGIAPREYRIFPTRGQPLARRPLRCVDFDQEDVRMKHARLGGARRRGRRVRGRVTRFLCALPRSPFLVDAPALRAAQERRRHHITSRLSAAHRARNAALLDLLAISDLEIGAVDTILESLAAEVVAPADPRVLQLLGAAGQSELVALYARTRTPAPPPAHRRTPRQQSRLPHLERRHRPGWGRVERSLTPVSAPPIRGGRRVLGHQHAGADCVSEASETLGWMM